MVTSPKGFGLENDCAGEDPAAIINDKPNINKPATV
jgi:hypothetical protein